MMSLSLLPLLMLLTCSCQATDYFGTVANFYPKQTTTNGSLTVVFRYKLNFQTCTQSDTWDCFFGDCGTESSVELHKVYNESSGEWCQREGIMTWQLPVNSDALLLVLDGGNWTSNRNGFTEWFAVTFLDLLTRSDTGQANRPPQTTILPVLRVPSNCQRDFNLLAFDPDGDEVRCAYETVCLFCSPPSVLSLSSSCSLSFSPTNSSNEGTYAVQLAMEDFPKQNITLDQTIPLPLNVSVSLVPVQFVFKVDPVVPSCTEGLYLPKFLPPTPDNRAQLYTPVDQTLEISINAEANNSMISELLFSGPYNVNQTTSGAGQFILRWTPSEDQDGESYPICFVVQAVNNSDKYHSELRCVIVTVGNNSTANIQPTAAPPTTTSIDMTTTQTTAVPSTTPPTTTSIDMTTTQTTAVPSTTPPTTTVDENTTQNMSTPRTTTPSTTLSTTTPSTTTPRRTTPSTTTPRTTTPSTTTPRTTTPRATIPRTTLSTTTPSTTTPSETTPSTTTLSTTTPSTTTPRTTTPSTTTPRTTTPSTTTPRTTTLSTTTQEATTIITTPDDTTLFPTPVIDIVNQSVVGLRVKLSSSSELSDEDIRTTVLQQLKDELVRRGLPPNITLSFKRRV